MGQSDNRTVIVQDHRTDWTTVVHERLPRLIKGQLPRFA